MDCGLGTDSRRDAPGSLPPCRRMSCRGMKCAKRTQFRRLGGRTRGWLYKQTQFAPAVTVSNKANLLRAPGGGRAAAGATRPDCAKRTQFRGVGRPDPGVGCTNKANSRRCRAGQGLGDRDRALLYKRTQFAGHRPGRMGRCVVRTLHAGPNAPNEANSLAGIAFPTVPTSTIPRFQSGAGCTNEPNLRAVEIPYYSGGLW